MTHARAKIVCTLGPSSSDQETIRRLVEAGMDIARLNFSHGSHEGHRRMIEAIRRVSAETGRIISIMMDLQGPKIRVGKFAEGSVTLVAKQRFTITTADVSGDSERVSTTYPGLPGDVNPGDMLLLDDGMLALKVLSKNHQEVVCEVVEGGELKDNKGINLPGVALSVETISKKDYADVDFALAEEVDFLAMSFVRHPDDVEGMRRYIEEKGGEIPIITKIEKPEAIDHIERIIEISDGIMVARGDLGVEMPAETVPGIQKTIIAECNRQGVPVITATQMLDSMINHPRPTRAEASDVANAVLDGSDAVMLSGESASGRFPVQSVEMMRRIVRATEEANPPFFESQPRRAGEGPLPVNLGIAISACSLANQVGARAIACITLTGSIAREISKYRPSQPIYAITHNERTLRRLTLHWGIEGILFKDLEMDNIDDALPEVERLLLEKEKLKKGDRFVLPAGLPFSARKATNMVRVDEV